MDLAKAKSGKVNQWVCFI